MASWNYRNNFYALCTPWLTTGNAEKYMYTLQLCSDLLVEKAFQASAIRLPGQGDRSQLPYLAFDRQLVQGPGETNASFVTRLRGAFEAWGLAGSRVAVLAQLQAYLQNLQPGVTGTLPQISLIGGNYAGGSGANSVATYSTLRQGDALGATPSSVDVKPSNFNWDGKSKWWRAWLVLFMSPVPTGNTGTGITTSATGGGSFKSPGQNIGGVWVPATSGAVVNAPFVTIAGLSGAFSVGQWITCTGSIHSGNNGTFQIAEVLSPTTAVIVNQNGVAPDGAGSISWSISEYPFIAPGPAWGTPNVVFGQGETVVPPITLGANVGGVWSPTTTVGNQPTISWGLNVSANTIASIRGILRAWKSAATYYESIVIAFDGGTGASGSAYSPNSTAGSGNPDGTFAGHGKNVGGVWVPNRIINSSYDAYCQGTGGWASCSVPNIS